MMKKALSFLIMLLFIFVTVENAYTHGGRLNSSGCHNDNRNGGAHCHRSSYTPNILSSVTSPASRSNSVGANHNKSLVFAIQALLVHLGYDVKGVDGVIGSKTKTAIRQYQKDNSLSVTGIPSDLLLTELSKSLLKAYH